MSTTHDIGPATLRSGYQEITNQFLELQSQVSLLRSQAVLDLPVDAGLAYEIKTYQKQFQNQGQDFENEIVPEIIGIISQGTSFYALWHAVYSIDLPFLEQAATSPRARTAAARGFRHLSEYAGTIHQEASALGSDLNSLDDELDALATKYDAALQSAIKELSEEAAAEIERIDQLEAAIQQNIDDIVAGAEKAGAATTELIVGILTTIKDAKPQKKNGGDGKKGKDPEKAKDDGGNKTPSTNFAVSAIKGARDGVAETAQARADLNANNVKLAAAYQELARFDVLVSVAKVVAVQNRMFTSAMKTLQSSTVGLATTWGQSPVAPPGSGISLAFDDFADQIDSVSTRKEVDTLVAQVGYASTDWALLNDKLVYLKRKIIASA